MEPNSHLNRQGKQVGLELSTHNIAGPIDSAFTSDFFGQNRDVWGTALQRFKSLDLEFARWDEKTAFEEFIRQKSLYVFDQPERVIAMTLVYKARVLIRVLQGQDFDDVEQEYRPVRSRLFRESNFDNSINLRLGELKSEDLEGLSEVISYLHRLGVASSPATPAQEQLVSATELIAAVISDAASRLEEIFDPITVADSDWYSLVTLVATAIRPGVLLEPQHAELLRETLGEHIWIDRALSSGDENFLEEPDLTISDFRREAMIIATWVNSCDKSERV